MMSGNWYTHKKLLGAHDLEIVYRESHPPILSHKEIIRKRSKLLDPDEHYSLTHRDLGSLDGEERHLDKMEVLKVSLPKYISDECFENVIEYLYVQDVPKHYDVEQYAACMLFIGIPPSLIENFIQNWVSGKKHINGSALSNLMGNVKISESQELKALMQRLKVYCGKELESHISIPQDDIYFGNKSGLLRLIKGHEQYIHSSEEGGSQFNIGGFQSREFRFTRVLDHFQVYFDAFGINYSLTRVHTLKMTATGPNLLEEYVVYPQGYYEHDSRQLVRITLVVFAMDVDEPYIGTTQKYINLESNNSASTNSNRMCIPCPGFNSKWKTRVHLVLEHAHLD